MEEDTVDIANIESAIALAELKILNGLMSQEGTVQLTHYVDHQEHAVGLVTEEVGFREYLVGNHHQSSSAYHDTLIPALRGVKRALSKDKAIIARTVAILHAGNHRTPYTKLEVLAKDELDISLQQGFRIVVSREHLSLARGRLDATLWTDLPGASDWFDAYHTALGVENHLLGERETVCCNAVNPALLAVATYGGTHATTLGIISNAVSHLQKDILAHEGTLEIGHSGEGYGFWRDRKDALRKAELLAVHKAVGLLRDVAREYDRERNSIWRPKEVF